MRLHSVSITAFGPFADTVEVDFDALSEAGLFLLTGDTGAGKTSVLDAVCFALYGDVPGDRGTAKRLRSDHAAPGVAPQVVLEATLSGRRFRFTRSPAWVRPKKRGDGTTQQQASVTLTELVDGGWTPLSTRLDEVGDLVSSLLGMSLAQFCQVAMLPQGRFQAFLRARSDERQAVLQQLFRTGRFSRMETWLRDHRLTLQRRSREHHDSVAGLVSRISEAAASPLPEAWDPAELERPAASGDVWSWADGLATEHAAAQQTAAARLPGAVAQEEASRLALEGARRTVQLRERHEEAETAQALLRAQARQQAARLVELEAARRAAAVSPLVSLTDQVAFEAGAARLRAVGALDRLHAHLEAQPEAHPEAHLGSFGTGRRNDLSTPEAEQLCRDTTARLVELAGVRGADERLLAARAEEARTLDDLAGARSRLGHAAEALAALPPRRRRLEAALESSRARAATAATAEREIAELEARLAAHSLIAELDERLIEARERRAACLSEVQDLTQAWLDLREARLQGMAAEIAGALAVGCSCPVCGSSSHPSPAMAVAGAPDAAAERAALKSVDDAKAVLHVHEDQVQQLGTQRAVALAAAGGGPVERVHSQLSGIRAELEDARAAQARVPELESGLADLEHRQQRLEAERQEAEVEAARLEVRHHACSSEVTTLAAEVAAALAGTGHSSVGALVEALETTSALAAELLELRRAADRATADLRRQQSALADALAEHGFDHAAAATAAFRDRARCLALQRDTEAHTQQEARVAALLQDPELLAAAAAPAVDLTTLESEHASCREAAHRLRTEAEQARGAAERLRHLAAELADALAQWAPVRDDLLVATDLAAFAEGKSADNRLQVRLSAYVLGYRLSQVVAAANNRLSAMSGQRYSLEHTGQRGRRETRGGLGLLVRDDWSGETRDPATLSGGETFVVSLALALGLADVIMEEAGGADLDTLFVDEGFGSLDADTLDDVLDTLDALRDGGRVVGVVSHVGEMRDRIPTQLRVLKGRSGSTLAPLVPA